MLGRTIDPVDDQVAGGNAVAVVSYKYWRERLAGDPKVVGTKILLNSYPFTVIGVTPPEFFGLAPGYPIDVFVPLKMIAPLRPGYAMTDTRYNVLTSPLRRAFVIMGRLRPGSTLTMRRPAWSRHFGRRSMTWRRVWRERRSTHPSPARCFATKKCSSHPRGRGSLIFASDFQNLCGF